MQEEADKISFWANSRQKHQLRLLVSRFKYAKDSTLYITSLLEKIRKKEVTHLSLDVLNIFAHKLYYGTDKLQKNVELALAIMQCTSTLHECNESLPSSTPR